MATAMDSFELGAIYDEFRAVLYSELFSFGALPNPIAQEFSDRSGYSEQVLNKYFQRIQKRYFDRNLDLQTAYGVIDLAEDYSRADNELEGLLKIEFPKIMKLSTIEKYGRSKKRWQPIDRLGIEYFREVIAGYSEPPEYDDRGKLIDKRSAKQVSTVNTIIERTTGYLEFLAKTFVEGKYGFTPIRKDFEVDEDGGLRVRVRGINLNAPENLDTSVDELVSAMSINLIRTMHTHLPEIAAMSSFIRTMATSAISKSVYENNYLVRIPSNEVWKLGRSLRGIEDLEEGIEKLLEMGVKKERSAQLLYAAIKIILGFG